ncbi:MAG: hypothetical protein RI942_1186 [Pseudomonadota bacterium]
MITAATSLGEFLDFPPPPSLGQKDLDPVRSGEHITMLVFHRGHSKLIDGHLMQFDLPGESVDLILQDQWDFSSFDFSEINYLTLTRPRKISEAEEVNHRIKVRRYDLRLLSDERLCGKTLPIIEDDKGIFLFPVDENFHYCCIFVPKTSLKGGYQLGAFETLSGKTKTENHVAAQKNANALINNADDLMRAVNNQPIAPQIKLGQLLLREKLIDEEQLSHALSIQKDNKQRPLGKILSQMGIISDADIQLALRRKLAIPFVDLMAFDIDQEVVGLLPKNIIRKHQLLPLLQHGNELIVALENPLDKEAIAAARFNTRLHVETVMASGFQLETRINEIFGEQVIDFSLEDLEVFDKADPSSEENSEEVGENDNTILRLANKIIIDAYRRGASDIHIEPYPRRSKAIVRFRIDGVLSDYIEVPANLRKPLVSRYKIMAGLDIAEKRKPQDGKINFKRFSNIKLELRVATIPTVGDIEDVVMRLLADSKPKAIKDLGLSKINQGMLEGMLEIPYGLILVCGPTGSGKTITLHSLLARLNTGDRKIWTAEDPVEITQRGLRQVQVNPKIDFTFANAMRSFLRADPDVIMVGEMRDEETAKIGIEASLTGHLVLSTLHTNSAPESIVRLLDMGMDPFNFAYSLVGVVAQRLARTLCMHCKRPEKLSEQHLLDLAVEYLQYMLDEGTSELERERLIAKTIDTWKKAFGDSNNDITTYHAIGCDSCDHSGYSGRIALHEVLGNSEELRRLIRERASVSELQHSCINHGMISLKQDGITKVLKGDTDMIQVRKVCIN